MAEDIEQEKEELVKKMQVLVEANRIMKASLLDLEALQAKIEEQQE